LTRRFVSAFAISTMALVGLAWTAPLSATAQAGASWQQFQGDAAHSGVPEGQPPEPPFRRVWRFEAGNDERSVSAPVVAEGVVAVAGRKAVYGADIATGTQAWEIPRNGGSVRLAPALATSGGKSVLMFGEGTKRKEEAKSKNARVRAYDLATQAHLWDATLDDLPTGGITIDGDRAYVTDRSGTLYAVDVSTGDIVWRKPIHGVLTAPPAAASGKVYFIARNRASGVARLVAREESSGKEAWEFSPSQPLAFGSSPTVTDRSVFVGLADRTVVALGPSDGNQQWSVRVPSATSLFAGVAPVDGDLVLAGTIPLNTAAGLYRLDGATGKRAWWFQFSAPSLGSSPVVLGGAVLLGLDDGQLAAVDDRTGEEIWEIATGPGRLGAIAAAGETVVVAKAGARAGIIGFRHDPDGQLERLVSPTVLNLPRALANYGVALGAVGVMALGLGRLATVLRRRRGESPPPADEEVAE
jgi:outer membrane protein assembly factor BamB